MKITTVVVTFNRLQLLKECLDSLRTQSIPLDEIIIVNNNSTDGTAEWLKTQAGITVINQENSGGAGGQHTGIQKAMENNPDWIWCMDDDAMPYPDALEKLVPFCQINVAALACSVVNNDGSLALIHRGHFDYRALNKGFGCKGLPVESYKAQFAEIGYATFVGILLNSKIVRQIGLPKKEIFLHFDDIEYSLRLQKQGKILLVPHSKILHKETASNHYFIKNLFGKPRTRIKFEKLWMRFYVIRNVTWGIKTYYGKRWDVNFILLSFFLKSLLGIILFDDHKIKRIRFFVSAFNDGLNARFNNSYEYINKKSKLYI